MKRMQPVNHAQTWYGSRSTLDSYLKLTQAVIQMSCARPDMHGRPANGPGLEEHSRRSVLPCLPVLLPAQIKAWAQRTSCPPGIPGAEWKCLRVPYGGDTTETERAAKNAVSVPCSHRFDISRRRRRIASRTSLGPSELTTALDPEAMKVEAHWYSQQSRPVCKSLSSRHQYPNEVCQIDYRAIRHIGTRHLHMDREDTLPYRTAARLTAGILLDPAHKEVATVFPS
jgi:hypothetical protein